MHVEKAKMSFCIFSKSFFRVLFARKKVQKGGVLTLKEVHFPFLGFPR